MNEFEIGKKFSELENRINSLDCEEFSAAWKYSIAKSYYKYLLSALGLIALILSVGGGLIVMTAAKSASITAADSINYDRLSRAMLSDRDYYKDLVAGLSSGLSPAIIAFPGPCENYEGWTDVREIGGAPVRMAGKFLVAAGDDGTVRPTVDGSRTNEPTQDLSNYKAGDQGGYENFYIEEQNIPAHSHNFEVLRGARLPADRYNTGTSSLRYADENQENSRRFRSSENNNAWEEVQTQNWGARNPTSIENRPPYIAVHFCTPDI